MPYTAAQTAAMNRQGQALLNSQSNGAYRPPTTTSASSVVRPTTTAGATTLGVGGSRASAYPTPTVSTPISSVGLGNQRVGTSSASTSRAADTTPYEQEAPSWIGDGIAPTSSDGVDITELNNGLTQAQINAMIASLDKQLGNQLSNVDSQYASIDSNAYNARNTAAAESDVSRLNFAQRAAAKGIQGNAGSMPEIYAESALQGRVGAIDSQALGYKNNLDSQKTNLRNSYESDLVAAQQGILSDSLQRAIDQANADRSFSLQEADTTGTYKGTTTLAGQQQQLSNQMTQLNIDAQEIQNSYLPETLKLEAARLKQDVESGRIDAAAALARLSNIKKSGTSGGLSFSQALDAWNSGIDTSAIRSALGMQ